MPFEATPQAEASAPALPYFEPRKNARCLDFRPVTWSLINRPDDWVQRSVDTERLQLLHQPTNHMFVFRKGPFDRSFLYSAQGCGCYTSAPAANMASFSDTRAAWRAAKTWVQNALARRMEGVNRTFTAHFLTPTK
jgi:hypothetical protein